MKFAIFFCFLVLIYVTLGDPRSASIRYWEKRLIATKDKVDEIIDKATILLKKKIGQIMKTTSSGIQKLTKTADQLVQEFDDKLYKILYKMQGQVHRLTEEAETMYNVNVSECVKMTDSVRETVVSLISNSSRCLTKEIDHSNNLKQEILAMNVGTLTDLDEIRAQLKHCIDKAVNFNALKGAVSCITQVGYTATWSFTKYVPSVILTCANIAQFISTLHTSQSFCFTRNSVSSVNQQTDIMLHNVKKCIDDKIINARE